jgi:hypothetical protein
VRERVKVSGNAKPELGGWLFIRDYLTLAKLELGVAGGAGSGDSVAFQAHPRQ